VEDDQKGDESSYSISFLVHPWRIALPHPEKAEALADNLEFQFQPVPDLSFSAVIEVIDVALKFYILTPASEPKLTTFDEVQEAIRCIHFSKAPVQNGVPDRALKHLPQRTLPLLVQIFNAFFLTITSLQCGSTLE
jgi:hypothetical protein